MEDIMDQYDQPKLLTKKPYLKPKIEQVRLVAEEAVLGVCQGTGKFGPIGECTLACVDPGS